METTCQPIYVDSYALWDCDNLEAKVRQIIETYVILKRKISFLNISSQGYRKFKDFIHFGSVIGVPIYIADNTPNDYLRVAYYQEIVPQKKSKVEEDLELQNIYYIVKIKDKYQDECQGTTISGGHLCGRLLQEGSSMIFELYDSKATVIIPMCWIEMMAPSRKLWETRVQKEKENGT